MPSYEVIGIPLEPSPVSGHRVGDVVELDLSPADEKAWEGAGAISRLPDPEPEPKPDQKPVPALKTDEADGSDKQDS